MFTGIIADRGTVRAVRPGADGVFEIATALALGDVAQGASIACAGVCLSVIEKGADWFAVQVSAETRARSTVGAWGVGTRLNLERSLRVGDELGGHIVLGHVDAMAELVARRPDGDSLRLTFEVPRGCELSIAPKGSITLDGVSLTVNEIEGRRFGVNIIPITRAQTTLGALQPGDKVNLELDVIARYVARLLAREPV
ncbi:MAG: riboflavin synthase [Alphaproteobacteria bacterium]|nr:riboflavin synthase [Alphaproteobacteria bacterium]